MSVRQELEIRRLRRDLARIQKAARNLLQSANETERSLYLAHERIEWLQGQIENQDDVRTLIGWLDERDAG